MAAPDQTATPSTLLDRLGLAEVERVICDLRHGLPTVLLADSGAPVLLAAAELVQADMLGLMRQLAHSDLRVVLSHGRADTLKIRRYTPDAVVLRASEGLDEPEHLRALADPSQDMGHPLQGPFEAERQPPDMPLAAMLHLMKLAELLPVVVAATLNAPKPRQWAQGRRLTVVQADAVRRFNSRAAESLTLVTSASLPLRVHEHATILAFRAMGGGADHFAIVVGDPSPDSAPLTRIHSQCFTGDLLGSLKCDCGEQLHGALARMAQSGGGVLIYLSQEGRGIGLVNKIRAYRLQDQGFDTVQANQRLGFAVDERAYKPASEILRKLGFRKIRLLTNNPAKLAAMERFGIHVVERVPLAVPPNRHNEDYLRTKAEKTGHEF